MAFLPIVERELRLASRRKSTARIRVLTTFAGLLVSFFFIATSAIERGVSRNLGQTLFTILTYYAFGLSLLAGVVLAADCISVEKREGNLGLLFLTDLKGYDVVFGKLIVVGLTALCGLVAVLPVTGLPVLMGGVTGAEYGRVAVALVNTLFFALATGMLVSTFSREANPAMLATLAMLTIVAVLLPLIGGVLSTIRLPVGWQYFTSFSPFNSFNCGWEAKYRSAPGRYWYSLLSSHLTAWLMLFFSSWALPRTWQDKPFRRRRATSLKVGSAGQGAAGKIGLNPGWGRLLDGNPIHWLAKGSASTSRLAWGVAWLCVATTGGMLFIGNSIIGFFGVASFSSVFILIVKILVAFQACRFFVNARRDGALELILSTPLTNQEIIQGQWLAMKQTFLWPVILISASQLVMAIFLVSMTGGMHSFGRLSFSAWAGNTTARWPMVLWEIGAVLYQLARSAGDIFAIGWTGMWFGLSAKKPGLAVAMTILFAWFLPAIVFCVPNLLIDLILCYLMREKLRYRLRSVATPHFQTLPGLSAPPATTQN